MHLEDLYILQEEIASLEAHVREKKRELKLYLSEHACDCCHAEGRFKVVPKKQEYIIEFQ
jgi:hypothetical protein